MKLFSLLLLLLLMSSLGALPSIMETAISCDKSDFLLRIRFNDTFTGAIFTEKGDPNCVYLNASKLPSNRFAVKIPLKGCETKTNEAGHMENEIVVQSGEKFNSKIDKRYLLTCIPAVAAQRDADVTLSFGGVTVDSAPTTTATLIGKPKVEYEVVVRDGDNPDAPELKRPLAVGDRVTYSVHLSSATRGRIGRCWASDGSSELQLSDHDGCSVQKAGDVWGDFEVVKDEHGTTFLNHIKAWAFPTSNEVNIFCNLHVCATCQQTICSRRLRRDPRDPFTAVVDTSDLSPPIPLKASFRLRRESPPPLPPPSQHQNTQSHSLTRICSRAALTILVLYLL